MLKRLIFDDFQGHYIMLPFFFKSGCHNSFFNLSNYMIRNALKGKFFKFWFVYFNFNFKIKLVHLLLGYLLFNVWLVSTMFLF